MNIALVLFIVELWSYEIVRLKNLERGIKNGPYFMDEHFSARRRHVSYDAQKSVHP